MRRWAFVLGEENTIFMRARFFASIIVTLAIAASITSAFGDTSWIISSGSNDWTSGANWNNSPAGDGNYGQGTISVATGTENIYYLNSRWTFYSGSGFTINNNDPSNTGTNTMIIGSDGNAYFVDGDYMWVQNHGKLDITGGGSLTAYQQFHLDAGGQLVLDNGSINIQNTDIGNVVVGGTVISRNGGTLNCNIFNAANALVMTNGSQIQVQSGLLWVETGGNTSANGFQLNSGATLTINSGAAFALDRNDAAWGSLDSNNPQINGTVMLNGGSITVYFNGNQATDRGMDNYGVIQGDGTIAMRVRQGDAGSVIASNGVLNLFQTIAGNQQTFTSNGSTLSYGTFKTVSGGTMRINGNVAPGVGFGGAWIVNAGGTLEISSGNSVDLGVAYMPGSAIQGTVKIDSGANMTLSSTVIGGGAYQDNQGTFLLLGGTVLMPNDTSHDATGEFTNSAAGVITGNGTLQTGFGFGNVNHAIINHGNITATNGTLVLNSYDANNLGGVQNAVDGTIVLANNGTLAVARTQNAWNNSGAVTNFGSVQMNGGDVSAVSVDGGTPSTRLANASGGLIQGSGTIDGSWSQLNNNGTIFANNQSPLILAASTLNNNSGGIVTANTASIVINGAFNVANGGTFASVSSVGTFNGAVVNSGAWITDPTTNVFNNTFTVASSGYISASAGDVYLFRSNFVNQSTQNTSYNTLNTTPGGSGASGTKFIFDNASAPGTMLTQQFFTAGLKLTGGFVGTPSPTATGVQLVSSFPAVTGFDNNFALDNLEIGNAGTNSILELSASADIGGASGDTNALFVNDLSLFGSSDLIISNNTVLYFVNSNDFSSADITLLGNGQIHQLELQQVSSVPEPSVVLLWLCGLGTAYGASRRAKNVKNRG